MDIGGVRFAFLQRLNEMSGRENNGIYDFAFTLRAMNSLKQQISELQEKYEEYENKLPVEIKNIIQKNTKE